MDITEYFGGSLDWLPAVVFVFIVAFAIVCVRQVGDNKIGILFQSDKYVRLVKPGFRIIIPVLQRLKIVMINPLPVDELRKEYPAESQMIADLTALSVRKVH